MEDNFFNVKAGQPLSFYLKRKMTFFYQVKLAYLAQLSLSLAQLCPSLFKDILCNHKKLRRSAKKALKIPFIFTASYDFYTNALSLHLQ
jgi:hypothetical protein